jgi:ABC-type bacteriocin/lantibiotic exporter with double-glycine peptidase domain
MIHVPYKKQKTAYTCGPASLKMMFLFYGISLTEEDLTVRLKTNADIGTRHSDMIRVAREEGFYVFENDRSSIVEIGGLIKTRTPVIVHFVEPSEDDNHYAVVVKIDDIRLVLNDPWNGERITMAVDEFITRWSSEHTCEDNWVMALSKEPFSLGRQYGPKRRKTG